MRASLRGRHPRERGLGCRGQGHRLLARRGQAEVEVLPGEIQHLVNALVGARARVLDLTGQEG
jgi:hypothetical protein